MSFEEEPHGVVTVCPCWASIEGLCGLRRDRRPRGKKGRASLEKDRETWRENTYLGGHFGRYWELFDKKKGSGSSRDREKRG